MKINTKEIIHHISHLKSEDMNRIEVSNRHLRHLRQNSDAIYNCKLSTIMKLQNYVNQEKNKQHQKLKSKNQMQKDAYYVGVDIGVSNLITVSDASMDKTVKLKTKDYSHIKKAIEQYEDAIKNIQRHANRHKRLNVRNKDFKHASKKFIRTIDAPLKKILRKDVILQFPKGTTYVIGVNHLQANTYSTHNLIVNQVISAMRRIFESNPTVSGRVLSVNERNTSIKCPNCDKTHRKSRTSKNRFKCQYCDFEHDDDDIVASCNILNNYLKIKKAGVNHGKRNATN